MAGAGAALEEKVLGAVHVNQLRGDVQEQGGVELAAVDGPVGVVELGAEVESENVHREDTSPAGAQRRKGLLVRVVSVGGEDHERLDAALLPRADEVVQPAV